MSKTESRVVLMVTHNSKLTWAQIHELVRTALKEVEEFDSVVISFALQILDTDQDRET